MTERSAYSGPALFSGGFRPFFLAATVFALCVVPVWVLVWRGNIWFSGPFSPVDWHIHEMIFGYGAAVVAGFLFTAVPNWTGRMPARGWPLAALLALWVAGRVALVCGSMAPALVLAIDQAFLLLVAGMIAREIVAGRNWRNLKVVVPVSMLWLTNLLFHFEVMAHGTSDISRRLGIGILIFLILLIGGRIVPSFTRNWLAKAGQQRMPVPFNRFDTVCLGTGAAALLLWTSLPENPGTGIAAGVAALLHTIRLSRWRGLASWRSPLLFMLHAAYAFVPAGFAAITAAAFGRVEASVPAHLFGIGAIGAMTVAVMIRASLGHTGRDLVAGPGLTAAFSLILLATLIRLLGPAEIVPGVDPILVAAVFWTVAFGLIFARLLPWLTREQTSRRKPNRRPTKPA